MTTPADYVLQLQTHMTVSPLIDAFQVIEQKAWPDRGYVRIRMTLHNGDFLEVAEYFVLEGDELVPHRYRYQWMDGERQRLRRRWDNIEHYPGLPAFPHHVHIGDEQCVEPSHRLSILDLLRTLSDEIAGDELRDTPRSRIAEARAAYYDRAAL